MSLFPVILSGGSGSRLWPLSREYYPKQLINLVGDKTMIQDTASRLVGLQETAAPLIVCNEEHRFLVAEQFREAGQAVSSIILEPVGRNTAPALTIAALALVQQDKEALMLVMPADHVIQDVDEFHRCVTQGKELALKGKLVTFGIKPSSAETGYGYIKCGPGTEVAAFVEKPDEKTAESYLQDGSYLWNSGMFMMKASVWLEELEKYRPDILQQCSRAHKAGTKDQDFFRVDSKLFTECPSDSIDYAVMERTEHAAVLPMDAGWSDVGAWSSLWQIMEQDSSGNVLQGDVYHHQTSDTLVLAQHRFVAAVGLKGIVVIETPDAVLVANKNNAQDVKKIVDMLKDRKRSEYQFHRRVYRPWGYYESVDMGPRFQVKRLTINPGAVLSLQLHHKRSEHWVVVKGTAKVTKGDEVFELKVDQSTYIPVGTKHRLENPGKEPLEIIEVQSGSYLGEDDIVRFEDIYNRVGNR